MSGRDYQITTINDLTAVPIDRLDACLADIKRALVAIYTIREIAGADPESLGTITWTDDGKDFAQVNLLSPDGSERILGCVIIAKEGHKPDPLEHLSDGMEAPGA